MSLTLHVDGDRWRAHLRAFTGAHPGIVPVAKGNGYGFGVARLARKTDWLGVDTLAVGTYAEVAEVATRFNGDILVLTPWRPGDPAIEAAAVYGQRVVHTVSRLEDVAAIAASADRPRVVLERLTSMRRHGMTAADLRAAAATTSVRHEGVALHLPMSDDNGAEVGDLMTDVVSCGPSTRRVFVSHLSDADLTRLRSGYPDHEVRPRIGTDLWLGDRAALRVTATVLDVHEVDRGDAFGYRSRTASRKGYVVVVSGGTAHGIGLEYPHAHESLRDRAGTLARGSLDAAGYVRSPYTVGGRVRRFAEPPHMQCSLLLLPTGSTPPAVGDEVDVRVRYTATAFDRVELS